MELEERMLRVEEKIAVTGQMSSTHREELNLLFEMFRNHMAKEEEQREETIALITDIKTELSKQKSFWAGITFAISAIWIVGLAIWHYFTK